MYITLGLTPRPSSAPDIKRIKLRRYNTYYFRNNDLNGGRNLGKISLSLGG